MENSTAEEAEGHESAVEASKLDDVEKETAEEVDISVEDIVDDVCPDEIYQNQSKLFFSVDIWTLECGVAPTAETESLFDYYTMCYDDSDD